MNQDQFMKYVHRQADHWYWSGSLDKDGYGIATDPMGKKRPAHVVSFMLFKDFVPGLNVLHKCDIRHCVNPDCLFQGTQKINMQDCVSKGRHRNQVKTHCKRGHAFTPENTIIRKTKKGKEWRRCLTCRRAASRIDNLFRSKKPTG